MTTHRHNMLKLCFGLLALSALAVGGSGCAQDSYYCDETGCFSCDGVGCRMIPPPERPICRGDFECTDSQHCTTLGCVDECSTSADCPQGTVCTGGECIGPIEMPGTEVGACVRSQDCPDGLICRDGQCTYNYPFLCTDGECACDATHACAEGYACVDGLCRAQSSVCQFNHECGADRVCLNGTCTAQCASGTCPTGQTCSNGTCVDVPPVTGTCTDNSGCAATQVCVDSTCIDACMTDAECGTGRYCVSGVCLVDDRPHPFCDGDDDCMPGHSCRGGVCRTPCTTNETCIAFDVQFGFCQDNLCVTSNEVTTDCHVQIDCSSGQNCLDGICR